MRSLIVLIALIASTQAYGQAVWNGRVYSAPQCRNGSCAMCYTHPNSIARQLARQVEPAAAAVQVSSGFIPSPMQSVDVMLELLDVSAGDTLYDLGCGDGRILKRAIERYRCQAVGIEINASTAALAARNLAGLPSSRVVRGDAADYDLSLADVVTLYLFPDALAELTPKLVAELRPGARVVSYQHPLPGVETLRIERDGHLFFVYHQPDSIWPDSLP